MANTTTFPLDRLYASRNRMISHMNSDHSEDLKLYLRYYLDLPSSAFSSSSSVTLTDIQLTHLLITFNNQDYQVNIQPPLATLSDSRRKLSQMSADARAGLSAHSNLKKNTDSVVVINTWEIPSPFGLLLGPSFLFAMWALLDPENFAERSPIRRYIFFGSAILGDIFMEWCFVFWWVILGIHVVETFYFWGTRLIGGKGRVESWWWGVVWSLDVMFEGAPAIRKWDKFVREGRGKKRD